MVVVACRKGAVAIMNQILGCSVVRQGVSKLLGGPRGRRMGRHGDVHDRLRSWASTTSTNSKRNVTVGTTKKSAAMICPA